MNVISLLSLKKESKARKTTVLSVSLFAIHLCVCVCVSIPLITSEPVLFFFIIQHGGHVIEGDLSAIFLIL
jgi:hypothetical protein